MVKMVTLIVHTKQISVGMGRKSLTKSRRQIVKTSILRKIRNVDLVRPFRECVETLTSKQLLQCNRLKE